MSSLFSRRNSSSNTRRMRNRPLGVEQLESREVMTATLWAIGTGTYDLSQTFALHSNPAAKQVVYLDFDGHTTGNVYGSGWDNLTSPAWDLSGNGPSFTTTEQQTIQRIWARVAEDMAPFNIDVTTQDPGVEALRKLSGTDDRWGIRVVFTPDDTPAPGAGGVAYLTSFSFNTDTPAYVFNVGEKGAAEAATHEVGHSFGLDHDGRLTPSEEYFSGHGSGVTSWGPIMGASYSPNVTQWSKGEYASASQKQDDLSIITTQNGFTYRTDDFGSTLATATPLQPTSAGVVDPLYGVIERNTDADFFVFNAGLGPVNFAIKALPLGPNLAVRADLYNSSGTIVATVNAANSLDASIGYLVTTAGTYTLKVSGAGRGDPLTNGFTNYGSLGNYRLNGTIVPFTGGGGGGTGSTNTPPVAKPDTAAAVAGVPVTINVLANDTDANGDILTVTGVSGVVNGTAVVSGNKVVFTPTAGFSGTGSFTYTIGDGRGGTASSTVTIAISPTAAGTSFTSNTRVNISSSTTSTVTSTVNVSGLVGTVDTVSVKLTIYHTYVSDLRITLIAPDGTRVQLFNRSGGSADNLINTVFSDAAGTAIANGAAPYTGTYRPVQSLGALKGKSPNGTWKLEVADLARLDGGYLSSFTVTIATAGTSAPAAPATIVPAASAVSPATILAATTWPDLVNRLFGGSVLVTAFRPANLSSTEFANLRTTVSRMTAAAALSLLQELYGIEREGDLPRFNG